MKAMLLAAGVGSRLEPLTCQIPKPLVPIANAPVMEHLLLLLKAHGITEVYANLHYLPEKIREYFGSGEQLGMKLTFHTEEKLSGDAGGVRAMKQHLSDETFIVVMGDLFTDADLTYIINQHKTKKAMASIAVKRVDDVTRFGIVVQNDDGFITGFQEKPTVEEALSDCASTGIYILEPEVFAHIPADGEFGFGRQLFPQLVKKGLPVLGIELPPGTYWSDVGTIPQYLQSNSDALDGSVKLQAANVKNAYAGGENGNGAKRDIRKFITEGTKIAEDAKIDGVLMTGKNCVIESNVIITGNVVLADNCTISEGAKLTDSVVWSNAKIGKNAKIAPKRAKTRNHVTTSNTQKLPGHTPPAPI
ncbi:MAG: NDP-sugar synthase [Leptolyngbya sp.]|nr:NDP-sugar synthase [Candidatus Melainabacteria bacterium]